MKSSSGKSDHLWRFLTNHTHVLQCIASNPTARLRDIAAAVGITERATATIVCDLEQAGYLTKVREGRRNRYEVHDDLPLRHPLHRHHTVGDLIGFLEAPGGEPGRAPQEGSAKPETHRGRDRKVPATTKRRRNTRKV